MKKATALILVPLGIGATLAWSSPPGARALADIPVSVAVQCQEGQPVVTVNPDQVTVNRGDQVVWTATGADSIQIVPAGEQWPFPELPPKARGRGPGEGITRSGQLPPGLTRGNRYPYSVRAFACGQQADLDPEIIIGEDQDLP